MAITLAAANTSDTYKNRIALLLFSQTYSNLTSNGYERGLIDAYATTALIKVKEYADFWNMVADTAPDEFEPWFLAQACADLAPNVHPERSQALAQAAERAKADALLTFARKSPTYAVSDTEAYVVHVQNVRYYVLEHCVRMRPPLLPAPNTIDAALDEVSKELWNENSWMFRKRMVTLRLTHVSVSGATWTESTKTLTKTGNWTGQIPAAGARLLVTGGTGATTGEYTVSSATADTVVLHESIGSGADGQTDIAGATCGVTMSGLDTSESFDSISSFKWHAEAEGEEGSVLVWADADAFARCRAADGTETGTPRYFRTQTNGSTVAWLFSPFPDTDLTFKGEVLTTTPANPSSTTATTFFDKFATEHKTYLRRATLDRVLTNYGRTDQNLHAQVLREYDTLTAKQDVGGSASVHGSVSDTEQTFDELADGDGMLGGRL